MVKDSRKAAGAGPIRPLNLPVPAQVGEDDRGRPATIVLREEAVDITSIDDLWEIADEWWTSRPIARRYYQVTAGDGRRLTIFQDLSEGGWYRQRG